MLVALCPQNSSHTYSFRSLLVGSWVRTPEQKRRRRTANRRFEEESLSYLRAIALFRQIERDHPDYASMDKVIFSQGMAWRLLIDYRPHYQFHPYCDEGWDDLEATAIRSTATAFERCAKRYPESNLADDALAAAGYWRRARPAAFRED